jgi:DNA-binding LytR/AlgR family response regulator
MKRRIFSDREALPKVLIVEDEFIVAYDLMGTLEAAGFGILGPVGTVADALAFIQDGPERRPDAVLLDVALGDGWSTPVAEALQLQGIPFAVTTGYGQDELAEPALRKAPYLPKPVNEARLGHVITRLVDQGGGAARGKA